MQATSVLQVIFYVLYYVMYIHFFKGRISLLFIKMWYNAYSMSENNRSNLKQ